MPWIVGGAILGSGVIGSMSSASAAERQNQAAGANARETNLFNAISAQKQMDFQERMSSTSYQRATKDMLDAGLNPMLAYSQGGASSPGGASATGVTPQVQPVNKWAQIPAAITGAAEQFRASQAQTKLLDAQVGNVEADTTAKLASAGQLDAARDKTRQEIKNIEADYNRVLHEAGIKRNEYWLSEAMRQVSEGGDPNEIARKWPQMQKIMAEIKSLQARAAEASAHARLYQLEVPSAEASSALWQSVGEAGKWGSGAVKSLQGLGPLLRMLILKR